MEKGAMMGKRGPKRKQAKREPNGRASRRLEEQAVQAVAKDSALDLTQRETVAAGVAARFRVHNVALELGVDQMAGSYVGRLCMAGTITPEQYHAAEMYAQEAEAYARACATPRQPGAIDLNATKGGAGGEENEARTRLAYQRYESSRRAIQRKQDQLRLGSHLFGAMQYLVINDLPLDHLIGDLSLALDALVAHYELDRSQKTLARKREAA